jgi:hypothetical protein
LDTVLVFFLHAGVAIFSITTAFRHKQSKKMVLIIIILLGIAFYNNFGTFLNYKPVNPTKLIIELFDPLYEWMAKGLGGRQQ